MTKQELVRAISHETGVDQSSVLATVEALMGIIKDTMSEGENVYLRGFGTFNLKKRAAKTARNITKQETLIVPEHYIPAFKPCPEFLNMVAAVKEVKE
ncbi:MAG: integration host factor subunit beta [Bacteroidaceae bacterium]|jgi:DNA-binding protein HU-beta|nr:integration host factor subunit beta [Bacteroidaceae bacterium]MBQ2363912.1 integration host factor subunit beta [Bacteroidaceae bacterium]MBQ5694995.1 integration host factor subunit beta [Bacteroidaceae bacterium]MBQ5838843.1 integration host factor subunit beta [Bacteroidaceae bacterium]MBQ5911679.1 integration host factor subunit beta [Bacteroidaceae bacterium]